MSKKKFDCVELKARIRARFLAETGRLGEEEARRVQWEQALRSPAPGGFISDGNTTHTRSPSPGAKWHCQFA